MKFNSTIARLCAVVMASLAGACGVRDQGVAAVPPATAQPAEVAPVDEPAGRGVSCSGTENLPPAENSFFRTLLRPDFYTWARVRSSDLAGAFRDATELEDGRLAAAFMSVSAVQIGTSPVFSQLELLKANANQVATWDGLPDSDVYLALHESPIVGAPDGLALESMSILITASGQIDAISCDDEVASQLAHFFDDYGVAAKDRQAAFEAIIADPAQRSRYRIHLRNRFNSISQGPPSWEDTPPDQRTVSPDVTGSDQLAELKPALVSFDNVPERWVDWNVSICARTSVGWGEYCILDLGAGDDAIQVWFDPLGNGAVEVLVFDGMADIRSPDGVMLTTATLDLTKLDTGPTSYEELPTLTIEFQPRIEDPAELLAGNGVSATSVRY